MSASGLIQVSEAPVFAAFDAAFVPERGAAENVEHERPDMRGPVCIVDDDDWVCDSLSVLLETYGFAVQAYSSGAEFLGDDRRENGKCLVIDQHMPGIDGLAVIAELNRQRIFVPTILITGRLDLGITQRARDLGVLAVLEKPFSVARLVELIQGAVGRRN